MEQIIKGYMGYELNEKSRNKLKSLLPPSYPDFIGHHCTVKFPAFSNEELPVGNKFAVVGYTNDGEGLEALILSIDDSIVRDDGSIYHITWSINRLKGYKPVDSNKIIKSIGYEELVEIPISMTPKFFRF